jgi:hypothetical protein
MENSWRIVSWLLTIGLILGPASASSVAEEAGPGGSTLPADAGVSQPSRVESAGEGAVRLDAQPQARSKGRETGTPSGEEAPKEVGGALNGPGVSGRNDSGNDLIDARIGVPRRLDSKRSKVENVKARVKLLAPRGGSTPGAFDRGMRNAIGAPLAAHMGQERRDSERNGVPSIVPNSSVTGVAASTKAEGHVEHPAVLRTDIGSGANLSRAGINGTGVTHLGAVQHSLGGPAKAVAGVNGSTVRSKH